jgi:hypothetical protein
MSDVDVVGKPALSAARASVARCFAQTLGEPQTTADDPAAGTKTYTFHPGHGGWMDLYAGVATLRSYGLHNVPEPLSPELWQLLATAIDRCRG